MKEKNYYEVLGVSKKATQEEIKKVYRELAKKTHPDVNPNTEDKELFKNFVEAYQILGNQITRKEYDRQLRDEKNKKYAKDNVINTNFEEEYRNFRNPFGTNKKRS